MRADTSWRRWSGLLLALAWVGTGCASMKPPGTGKTLSYIARAAGAEPVEHEAPGTESVESDSSSDEQKPRQRQRLYRRHEAREPLLGAGPAVRGLPAVAGMAVGGSLPREDAWEQLLTNAGLAESDERPLPGSPLTATQAERLVRALLNKPATRGTFPARMAVGHVLRQALEHGELSREELRRWGQRFARVVVLRPDGYLAWVRDGRTQQKAFGEVQWREGAFRSGPFELGRFYVSNGFVFRLADANLEPVEGPVLVEVYDDADYLSRSLDGAEAAVVAMALAVGQLLTHPADSLVALQNLPAGVAELIASSPEYLERFRYMTRGEQVEVVAELVTTLLLTKGTAGATTRTVTGAMVGAEATVPVLALSADGVLVLERVAVPVEQAARALSGAPGAALLLHRANTGAGGAGTGDGRGPGEWGPAQEAKEPGPARDYQEYITGHTADEAYWVGGVGKKSGGTKFDGFKDGVLIEAKGPGYLNKFEDNLNPKYWFKLTGAQDLIEQARRQCERVRGTGFRIEWYVAEKKTKAAIEKLFEGKDFREITVIHKEPPKVSQP
jgi:hypothetical protein